MIAIINLNNWEYKDGVILPTREYYQNSPVSVFLFNWLNVQNLAILSPTDNPDNMLKLRGEGGLGTPCFSDSACASGLYCFACPAAGASGFQPKCTRCRITPTSAFPKVVNLAPPFIPSPNCQIRHHLSWDIPYSCDSPVATANLCLL